MQVRVKPDHRYGVHLAFSRLEFIKGEWRNVPEHVEKELRAHPEKYPELETREPISPEAIETVSPAVTLVSEPDPEPIAQEDDISNQDPELEQRQGSRSRSRKAAKE